MILPDSVLWIDFMRKKTPHNIRLAIAPYLASRKTMLCEPVRFEVMRGERKPDRQKAEGLLTTVPMLRTPVLMWQNAELYGQICLDSGLIVPPVDLLIASVAVTYNAEVITFDGHFEAMAKIIPKLKARVLVRPQPV